MNFQTPTHAVSGEFTRVTEGALSIYSATISGHYVQLVERRINATMNRTLTTVSQWDVHVDGEFTGASFSYRRDAEWAARNMVANLAKNEEASHAS